MTLYNVSMNAKDPRLVNVRPFLKRMKEGMGKLSPAVQKKLADLMEKHPKITQEQLKQVSAPTLIVAGDHDVVNIQQTLAMLTKIPHSQLLIMPGASHLAPVEHPGPLNAEVIRFLKTPFHDIGAYYFAEDLQ